MADISIWSTTAGSNNSASPDGFPENMAPSGVNDAAREVMAAIAAWYQDAGWTLRGRESGSSSGSQHTVTYATGTTFTTAAGDGDTTGVYLAGRRIKVVVTAGTLYGRIQSSSHSSVTTVTVDLDSGSLDSGLDEVYIGLESLAVSPAQTRGDLIYADAYGPGPLAVGTAGQKLVSDGTDPTWASTGWEYVDKLDSFDGTTQAEFTDLDAAYDHIFWLHKVRCESNGDTFILRTSSDNGSTYDSGASNYLDRFLNIQSNTSTITNASSLGTSIYAATFLVGEAAGDQYGMSGWVYLPNLGAGVNQDIELHTFGYTSVGSWGTSCGHSGIRLDSTAVDAIQFSMVTEQIKSGAIYHYRRKVGS